jgi:L-ascorbate metabolism protein UlaG (beta-lactamase superfamily)
MDIKANCKLIYYGVSAFTLESDSTKIGIDFWHKNAFPYAEDISDHSEFDKSNIDKILITHDHADHCYVPEGINWLYAINDEDKIVDNDDFGQVGSFKVGAYYSQHFPEEAPPYPKANTVFKITIDSLLVM